jgi:hypothetical protein
MYICTPSLTSALDGVCVQRHAPTALPPGKIWCPLYRRLGGPQGRSGRVRKVFPPSEFDPRTVQPIPTEVSRPITPIERKTRCIFPAASDVALFTFYIKAYRSHLRTLRSSPVLHKVSAWGEQRSLPLVCFTFAMLAVLIIARVVTRNTALLKCCQHLCVLLKKIDLLRAVAPCGLVYSCRCSERLYCFHLQGGTTVVHALQDQWQLQVWAPVTQTVLSGLLAC